MGEFQNNILKDGKIFVVKNDNEILYQGKFKIGYPSDIEGLFVENGEKVFTGKIVDGEIIEGRNIYVDQKWDKKDAYYLNKEKNNISYKFDLMKMKIKKQLK